MPLPPDRYLDLQIFAVAPGCHGRTFGLTVADATELVRYVEAVRLERLRPPDGLLTAILSELSHVVGDNGQSEGAVEVCKRMVAEHLARKGAR